MASDAMVRVSRAINGVPTPKLPLQLSHRRGLSFCNELANGEDDVLSRLGLGIMG